MKPMGWSTVEAQAMPKATEAQKADRQRSIEAALAHAAEEPLKAAALSLDVLHLSKQLLDIQNTNLASDIGCAAEFAFAAIVGSGYNVRINHRFMRDDALILKQAKLLNRFEQEGGQVVTYVRHAIGNAMRKERPAAAPK